MAILEPTRYYRMQMTSMESAARFYRDFVENSICNCVVATIGSLDTLLWNTYKKVHPWCRRKVLELQLPGVPGYWLMKGIETNMKSSRIARAVGDDLYWVPQLLETQWKPLPTSQTCLRAAPSLFAPLGFFSSKNLTRLGVEA